MYISVHMVLIYSEDKTVIIYICFFKPVRTCGITLMWPNLFDMWSRSLRDASFFNVSLKYLRWMIDRNQSFAMTSFHLSYHVMHFAILCIYEVWFYCHTVIYSFPCLFDGPITWFANHMDHIRFVLPFNDVKEVNTHALLTCIWSIRSLGCLQVFILFYCPVTLKKCPSRLNNSEW